MQLEKLGKLNHPIEKLFHNYFHFHPFIKFNLFANEVFEGEKTHAGHF